MATLTSYNYIVTVINGITYTFGSLSVPKFFTLSDENAYVYSASIPVSSSASILDVSTDISDFDFLLIASDYDVMIEFVTDDGDHVGERSYTIEVAGSGTAGEMGIPSILTSNSSYANYTVGFAGGTLDVIEKVTAKNNSTTTAAKVFCLAFS